MGNFDEKECGLPAVISVNAALPAGLYKKGLRKPSTGLPAASRRSLTSAIMLAKIGLEQLAPLTAAGCIEFFEQGGSWVTGDTYAALC